MINAATRLVGILGYPVEHSLSPLIHNAAFRAQKLNMLYVGLGVPPDRLQQAVMGLSALGFVGANVTIPHKSAILPMLDVLSERSRVIGAVNTVVVRDGALYGDNTDVAGFLVPLVEHKDRLHGQDMVVLGAGGAARAAVYALLTAVAPRKVTIAARRITPAARIAWDMASFGEVKTTLLAQAAASLEEAYLIVNTTPVGMHPYVEATPWEVDVIFNEGQLVYDLIYRPRETRLLRLAAVRGAQILGGLPMLVGQAAEAYHQWTGHAMPLAAVEKVLEGYVQNA